MSTKNIFSENYTKISPQDIPENVVKLIGTEWMIISAGNEEKFNGMTACWGGLGVWNGPVAFYSCSYRQAHLCIC